MSETVRTGISESPLQLSELHAWAKHRHAGAVVTFSGITRDSFEGHAVRSLSYDCYKPRAEKTLQRIAEQAQSQFSGIQKVAVYHRIGDVPLSEESVLIVVSASHRGEAWEAAEWCLEEIKATVEIWKREEYDDGTSQWVESCQAHPHAHKKK